MINLGDFSKDDVDAQEQIMDIYGEITRQAEKEVGSFETVLRKHASHFLKGKELDDFIEDRMEFFPATAIPIEVKMKNFNKELAVAFQEGSEIVITEEKIQNALNWVEEQRDLSPQDVQLYKSMIHKYATDNGFGEDERDKVKKEEKEKKDFWDFLTGGKEKEEAWKKQAEETRKKARGL